MPSTTSRLRQDLRGENETRLASAFRVIREVTKVLGSNLSIELEVPCFPDDYPEAIKMGKQFCVGLLENPGDHAWWPKIRSLGHRERVSVAGTLFLCRKVLPSLPDPRQATRHLNLMKEPAPSPSPDYLRHIDLTIDELFVNGWDKGYKGQVYSYAPNVSSCREYSRRHGGARRFLSEQGRDWFADACLGETSFPPFITTRYSVVSTPGKERGVTVPDGTSHVLGPLHRTLYDYLSQFEWLLRGDARGKKFKGFQRKRGEVFVSGDYESATDNLSTEVAERILSRVLFHCRTVPISMRQFAMRSLRAVIEYPGGRAVYQQRGQLQGSLLSFPLLCLQNYIAFRYFIPRPVPVRINGDDIVFRCRPAEYERWREGVGSTGLTLSVGKTMVNRTIFSLNSSFYDAGSRRVREIPVIRGSSLIPKEHDAIPSGGGFVRFIRNWKLHDRRRVGALWLRSFGKMIRATGRSVSELGIPADNSQLHTANLSVREAFFRGPRRELRLQEEPIPRWKGPRLRDQHGEEWVCTQENIRATPAEERKWLRCSRDLMSGMNWQYIPCIETDNNILWERIKVGSKEQAYHAWRSTVKRASRLLGRRPYNSTLRLADPRCRKVPRWIPASELAARRLSLQGIGMRRF